MRLPRLLTLLFVLAACAGQAVAATVSERTPVRLGLWYDPLRSGSGFELFAAGEDQVLVWYTYGADGQARWYTAAGRFSADGVFDAPLQKHSLRQGARQVTDIGRVHATRRHREKLDLQFSLSGAEGRWTLVPFPVSGIVPEIDHSGAYADPRRPGYGVSLTEQGAVLVAALYFYDAAGEPTWRAGDNGGEGTLLTLKGFTGPCPTCPWTRALEATSGTMRISPREEHRIDVAHADPAWPIDGALYQMSTPASRRPADRQLAAFDDEPALREWLRGAVLDLQSPAPVIDFSPPPAMDTFSATNTQESGVDEADIVESDGRFLYAIAPRPGGTDDGKTLRIAETLDGSTLQLHPNRDLASLEDSVPTSGLYLHEGKLAVVASTAPSYYAGGSIWTDFWPWTGGRTRIEILDRGNPRQPASTALLDFDAHLVSSRRIGDRLYVVMRKSVALDELSYPTDDAVNRARNRALFDATATVDLLPSVKIDGGAPVPAVAPSAVYLPVTSSREATPEFVTVVGIDLDDPRAFKAIAVAGSVDAVYVSPRTMYVATTRAEWTWDSTRGRFATEGLIATDVHRIALGADGPAFSASGSVEGFLDRDVDRGAFRFSERDGRLRLVTVGDWGALGQNRVTVLEPSAVSPGLLRTISVLPNKQRPEPIGKPGEQLYGTRYVGDKLYAVTFLRTDPLYVIDLADPADPKIDGALELPGYSDYLHPVGDGLLLGIGYDAIEMPGWSGPMALFQGVQFNLFDVSDPARPRLLDQEIIGQRGTTSAVFQSHHALSALKTAAGTQFALPMRVHLDGAGDPPPTSPTHYARWNWSGLQRIEVQGHGPQDARLVVGEKLVTHSRAEGNPPGRDDSAWQARSVQFTRGSVYLENGRFWLANAVGGLLAGPL